MTRGAQRDYQEDVQRKAAAMQRSKAKKVSFKSKVSKKKVKTKKSKKEKKQEKMAKKASAAPHDGALTEESFRRNDEGRQCILDFMTQLHSLDEKRFGSTPAFSIDGSCGMKFEGASKLKWDDMLKASPDVFESMRL